MAITWERESVYEERGYDDREVFKFRLSTSDIEGTDKQVILNWVDQQGIRHADKIGQVAGQADTDTVAELIVKAKARAALKEDEAVELSHLEWRRPNRPDIGVFLTTDAGDNYAELEGGVTVTEEGGAVNLRVRLKAAPVSARELRITATTTWDGDTASTDLVLGATTLTFLPADSGANSWAVPQTVTLTAAVDADSQDETVYVHFKGDDIATQTLVVTVRDND